MMPRPTPVLDTSWMDHAACQGVDPNVMFPPKGTFGRAGDDDSAAKRICRGCPVITECLDFALRQPGHGDCGVWGGTNARERRDLRRARPCRPAGSVHV